MSTVATKIATLNDRCRQAWGVYPNTRVVITAGISALSEADRSAIAEKVQTFDSFNEDNDPHGEHDFGALEHGESRIFWKIDYFDRASFGTGHDMGSDDPSDPAKTVRVLTIMLAEEY